MSWRFVRPGEEVVPDGSVDRPGNGDCRGFCRLLRPRGGPGWASEDVSRNLAGTGLLSEEGVLHVGGAEAVLALRAALYDRQFEALWPTHLHRAA